MTLVARFFWAYLVVSGGNIDAQINDSCQFMQDSWIKCQNVFKTNFLNFIVVEETNGKIQRSYNECQINQS